MLRRLSVALVQVKESNTSENLLQEIRHETVNEIGHIFEALNFGCDFVKAILFQLALCNIFGSKHDQ